MDLDRHSSSLRSRYTTLTPPMKTQTVERVVHNFLSGIFGAYSNAYDGHSVSSSAYSRYDTPKETFVTVNGWYGPSWKHHGNSSEYRNLSAHRQRQSFANLNEVHIILPANQQLPHNSL
ncbi:hypothetical protein M378DRAFT_159782, partial [Amanita muscaria Koide BX008]